MTYYITPAGRISRNPKAAIIAAMFERRKVSLAPWQNVKGKTK